MKCNDDEEYTWNIVAGDDSTRVFEYRDENDDPINLTGYSAVLTITFGTATHTVNGTVGGTDGRVTVIVPHTLTSILNGNGAFKLRLTSGGGLISTLVRGPMRVRA